MYACATEPAAEPVSGYWSGYDVLWGLRPAPTRRTALDRARIVNTAIEVADHDGLAAVTMRTVAHTLGAGPMSLYRHVPDKNALVSMMVDAVIADATRVREPIVIAVGWRDGLRLVAASTWRLCRAHPWYPEASMVRPLLTPSAIAGFERALSIFDGFDLDIGTKAQFVGTVHSTVISAALNAEIERAARARARISAVEAYIEGAPIVERVISSGEYPRVSAFITDAEHLDEEARMWAGVELILDGVAARIGDDHS